MTQLDLVTGAAGFSGMYVVRELLARGRRVIVSPGGAKAAVLR